MTISTKMTKIICLFFAILFCFSPVLYAEQTEPVDPNDENSNQSGFWYSVFWGTPDDPGIFRQVFQWFLNLIDGFGNALITTMCSAFDISVDDYSSIVTYFRIAERWVPLSYFFYCLFAYWAFLGVFIAVKFVLKLIPFIG